MADRILKSITFPDLPDKYLIPQGDVTKADLENFAENGTVANARQLVASIYEEDKTPYNFRTSGGSLDIGDREYLRKIVGGTVAWNQLVRNPQPSSDSYWGSIRGSLSYANNVITMTADGTGLCTAQASLVKGTPNHKYFVSFDINVSDASKAISMALSSTSINNNTIGSFYPTSANTWQTKATIFVPTNDSIEGLRIAMSSPSNGDTMKFRNVIVIDLTQMFGSTIADYIYSLETATAGAGVAWFKKLFPKDYYAYNAGELISVKTSKHITTGFNQMPSNRLIKATYNASVGDTLNTDAPTTSITGENPITINATSSWQGGAFVSDPMVKDCQYQLTAKVECGTATNLRLTAYIVDKDYKVIHSFGAISSSAYGNLNYTYTPTIDGARFVLYVANYSTGIITVSDLCVHLAWDNSRNGEYEAYEAHEYALDDVELRGIPKLDSSNNLYYDGDEYESDGTVTRRYTELTLDGTQSTNFGTGVSGDVRYFTFALPFTSVNTPTSGQVNAISNSFKVFAGATVGNCYVTGNGLVLVVVLPQTVTTSAEAKTYFTSHPATFLLPLATPTTETADPYQETQIVNDFGTEEFVDTRTIPIPVGHSTDYQANLVAKLEMSPVSPNGNGEYIVKQTSGENEYISLVSSTTIQNIIARLEALEG